ncbi:unnamed protein product, partial [Prorocentrum cordatum]
HLWAPCSAAIWKEEHRRFARVAQIRAHVTQDTTHEATTSWRWRPTSWRWRLFHGGRHTTEL